MRRLMVFISALAMGIAILAIPTPASAMVQTTNRCFTYSNIATCFQVEFRTQDDGTGVRVEGLWVNTNQGCGSLEDSGGKYSEAQGFIVDPDTSYIMEQGDWGAEDCNWYKDLEMKGPGTGPVDFRVSVKARVNNGDDQMLYIGWKFYPNETSSLQYMTRTSA